MMRTLMAPLAAAALAGCAGLGETNAPAMAAYHEARQTLQAPLQPNKTALAGGVRCMDLMLERHGVALTLLVEDLPDKSGGKATVGTQDMMLASLSQMTQRSGKSIRTLAYGPDTRNLAELMRLSGSKAAFRPEVVPAYALRGAVSQYDENLVRSTVDGGVSLGPIGIVGLGAGSARSTSVNLVALDLALVDARDWSLVAGVNTSNVAAIVQQGKGVDGEVSFHKRLGLNYGRSFARSDGRSVALRHLVDLSAIELLGRFGKVPYWQCTGTPVTHPDVAQTIDDWVASMNTTARLERLLAHFRRVGMFGAEGEVDPALFKLAFRHYAQALGADPATVSDLLMKAHFAGDIWAAGQTARQAFGRDVEQLPAIDLGYEPQSAGRTDFVVQVNRPAHVQCFMQADPRVGYRPLATLPAGPIANGRRHRLRDLARAPSAGAAGTVQSVVCLASANDRRTEVADLWQRVEQRHAVPGFEQVRALRHRLAAQGDFVAMAALVARIPRSVR